MDLYSSKGKICGPTFGPPRDYHLTMRCRSLRSLSRTLSFVAPPGHYSPLEAYGVHLVPFWTCSIRKLSMGDKSGFTNRAISLKLPLTIFHPLSRPPSAGSFSARRQSPLVAADELPSHLRCRPAALLPRSMPARCTRKAAAACCRRGSRRCALNHHLPDDPAA